MAAGPIDLAQLTSGQGVSAGVPACATAGDALEAAVSASAHITEALTSQRQGIRNLIDRG